MNRRSRRYERGEDDSRSLANRSIEGIRGDTEPTDTERPDSAREPLTKRETRILLFASLRWALLVSAGFALLLILLILFCTKVWLA